MSVTSPCNARSPLRTSREFSDQLEAAVETAVEGGGFAKIEHLLPQIKDPKRIEQARAMIAKMDRESWNGHTLRHTNMREIARKLSNRVWDAAEMEKSCLSCSKVDEILETQAKKLVALEEMRSKVKKSY